MNIKFVTVLTLIALATIFIVQNATVVDLRFLFWTLTLSRSLMFVFLILIGILIGWLLRGHMLKKNKEKAPSKED